MDDLERSVIATLAYYHAFDWPLTPLELWQRLIPVQRLGGNRQQPSLLDVMTCLDGLSVRGIVSSGLGLFTLVPADDGLFFGRMAAEKICAGKWRSMLRRAYWFQAVPYVWALFASGSMALGNIDKNSDWDVLAVVKRGRLYTARTGLLVAAWLMGRLRRQRDSDVADLFCFNHLLVDGENSFKHRSLYTAHSLAALIPFWDQSDGLSSFWRANVWINDFIAQPVGTDHMRRSVKPSAILAALRRSAEFVLNLWLGDWLESVLARWQKKRIAQNPATLRPVGRIVFSDTELEFHPRSFERRVLDRYNTVLVVHDLGRFIEHDSGLTF